MSDTATPTQVDAPSDVPVPEPVPVVSAPTANPVRTLDAIHQDLVAAKAAHAANLAAVQKSQTVLSTLTAEFHSALSWFGQEEKKILSDIDDMSSSAGSWFTKALKAI